ncbi:MAG: nucleotidyltransferase domain-containing protein [Pseudobdellovibrionaceae bacterium]
MKIKNVLTELQLLPSCKIFLFGSRLYDNKKGGDIDLLLLCSEVSYKNILNMKFKIKAELEFALDEQRVDLTIATQFSLDSDPFLLSIRDELNEIGAASVDKLR